MGANLRPDPPGLTLALGAAAVLTGLCWAWMDAAHVTAPRLGGGGLAWAARLSAVVVMAAGAGCLRGAPAGLRRAVPWLAMAGGVATGLFGLLDLVAALDVDRAGFFLAPAARLVVPQTAAVLGWLLLRARTGSAAAAGRPANQPP